MSASFGIPLSQKGAPGGVATLDQDGNVAQVVPAVAVEAAARDAADAAEAAARAAAVAQEAADRADAVALKQDAATAATDAELSAETAARVAAISALPSRVNTIGLLGASTEQNCGTAEPIGGPHDPITRVGDYGYLGFAIALLGWSPLRFTHQYGVSGDTSAMILARVPAALAQTPQPDCWVIGSGMFGNDFTTLTVAQSKANMAAIVAAMAATGKLMIIQTAQPHDNVPGGLVTTSAQYQDNQSQLNEYARQLARDTPNALLCDQERVTTDAITGKWLTGGYTGDGLHPYKLGAYIMGVELAAVLRPYVSATDAGPANALDPYNLLGSKGFLQGTTGTKIASFTGTVATGWTLADAKSTYGEANVAAGTVSLIDRGDGKGNWQKVTVTSRGAVSLYTTVTSAAAGVAVGDHFRAAVEFKTDNDWVNPREFGLLVSPLGSVTNFANVLQNSAHAVPDAAASRFAPRMSSGVLRSQRTTRDSSAAGQAFYIQVLFWADAGTFYISRAQFKRGAAGT